MKKRKFSTIEIRRTKQAVGSVSTGSGTEVLLDGKLLSGCSRVTFDVQAAGVAKVNLEMFAIVSAKVAAKLKKTRKLNTGMTTYQKNKLSVYEIGNYFPKAVVYKKSHR